MMQICLVVRGYAYACGICLSLFLRHGHFQIAIRYECSEIIHTLDRCAEAARISALSKSPALSPNKEILPQDGDDRDRESYEAPVL
jgi:hypothetical protein